MFVVFDDESVTVVILALPDRRGLLLFLVCLIRLIVVIKVIIGVLVVLPPLRLMLLPRLLMFLSLSCWSWWWFVNHRPCGIKVRVIPFSSCCSLLH